MERNELKKQLDVGGTQEIGVFYKRFTYIYNVDCNIIYVSVIKIPSLNIPSNGGMPYIIFPPDTWDLQS